MTNVPVTNVPGWQSRLSLRFAAGNVWRQGESVEVASKHRGSKGASSHRARGAAPPNQMASVGDVLCEGDRARPMSRIVRSRMGHLDARLRTSQKQPHKGCPTFRYHCAQMICGCKVRVVMNPQIRSRRIRRSKRLVLSVRVHVVGQDAFRESFSEFTRMLSVNAHGGSLALAARVEEGQRILVVNRSTREEQECQVVDVGSLKDSKWTVGIEFTQPVGSFWRIHFPVCIPGRPSNAA